MCVPLLVCVPGEASETVTHLYTCFFESLKFLEPERLLPLYFRTGTCVLTFITHCFVRTNSFSYSSPLVLVRVEYAFCYSHTDTCYLSVISTFPFHLPNLTLSSASSFTLLPLPGSKQLQSCKKANFYFY